jgi:GT2 family glycosyltransferase
MRTSYANFKVVVVDNLSTDGSLEIVREKFPQVELITNNENSGFADGNNIGISRALKEKADYIVLLNPDTKVQPNWLSAMIDVAEQDPSIGILGAVQLKYDSDDFNSWTTSFAKAHLSALDRPDSAPAWIPMRWVEGSCFAVRRDVFESIGLLDTLYHTFYEEIDFCRRAAFNGYKIALVPRSRYHHYRGAIWKANPTTKREREKRMDRSHLIYSLTDPQRSRLGNIGHFFVTLSLECASQLVRLRFYRLSDLAKLQSIILRTLPLILDKWKRDRSRVGEVGRTPATERSTRSLHLGSET